MAAAVLLLDRPGAGPGPAASRRAAARAALRAWHPDKFASSYGPLDPAVAGRVTALAAALTAAATAERAD